MTRRAYDRTDDDAREMRDLARRVHQRWLEYRRRHPQQSVPIDDALSRILELDPEYQAPRPRTAKKRRPPLQNPGIFTVKAIATSLETTVGDLLGERREESCRDVLTAAKRRKLRETVELLRATFDLDDIALTGDFETPEPLHVWVGNGPDRMREVSDPRLCVIRVRTDAMMPEIVSGSSVILDIQRTVPEEGDLVAVQTPRDGPVLGRWTTIDGKHALVRSNQRFPRVVLTDSAWTVLGTVLTSVKTATRLEIDRVE